MTASPTAPGAAASPREPVAVAPAVASGPLLLGMFLVSAATLHLQILQTRIFSVLLWHHVTYLVVTFTMLGFAVSGTLLALFPRLLDRAPARFLGACSLLFALTTHASYQVLGRSEIDTLALLEQPGQFAYVFVYYLYLVVPYVFAGLVVVGGLKVATGRTGLVYGSNLAGSAAGCLLFALTLGPLGGERAVFLAAALAALAGAVLARGGSPRPAAAGMPALVVALASAALLSSGDLARSVLPLRAAPTKGMVYMMDLVRAQGKEPSVLASRWDPLCRIDVVDLGNEHDYRVYQDADAPTSIFSAEMPHDPLNIYSFSYHVRGGTPEVLVIGVGGGQDLLHALNNGATSVTGVEINRTTAGLMRNEFAEYSGSVYSRPGVEVIETEGRSFIRRTDRTFDVIQMTGTDTYAALASGSYVLSESYLYTVDAFRDYFDHLRPDGLVSVMRWRFFPPRESLRLVAIAVEALRERGAESPERHVIVVDKVHEFPHPRRPGELVTLAYSALLFKPTPFTDAEVARAREFIENHPERKVYSIAYAPGRTPAEPNEFDAYFAAVRAGTEQQFLDAYPYRVGPVDDDSPFFFDFHRWSKLLSGERSEVGYKSAIGDDPVGPLLLATALVEATALVALLVILPLVASRRIRLPREGRGSVLLYFLGLGVGFLFLEIAAMQRLVLYLGHPTRSITVVLFTFLLFSGLGAATANRLRGRGVPRAALVAIVLLVAAYALLLPRVLDATLGLETNQRIAIAVALLGLPSFFMGMPFPTALARLHGPRAPFLPWAFAINGGASVVASVAAIFLAMAAGFTAVFWAAAAFYLLALLAERGLPQEG